MVNMPIVLKSNEYDLVCVSVWHGADLSWLSDVCQTTPPLDEHFYISQPGRFLLIPEMCIPPWKIWETRSIQK